MALFVKVSIQDEAGRTLQHYYLRAKRWDLPAGKIEEGETPKAAAVRELLERTGFAISEEKLFERGFEGEFSLFEGKSADLIQAASPGEKGGYATCIRWH